MTGGADRITNTDDARREIIRLKQELDSTYGRYNDALSDIPINFQGEVHRYMCIRFSGYLEQLFFCAITGYLKSVGGRAGAFALSHFPYAPNLRPDSVAKLVARFGDEWAQSLEQHLDAENRRQSLGTLLAVRNKTAHGESYRGSAPSVRTYKHLVDDLHNWVLSTVLKS